MDSLTLHEQFKKMDFQKWTFHMYAFIITTLEEKEKYSYHMSQVLPWCIFLGCDSLRDTKQKGKSNTGILECLLPDFIKAP